MVDFNKLNREKKYLEESGCHASILEILIAMKSVIDFSESLYDEHGFKNFSENPLVKIFKKEINLIPKKFFIENKDIIFEQIENYKKNNLYYLLFEKLISLNIYPYSYSSFDKEILKNKSDEFICHYFVYTRSLIKTKNVPTINDDTENYISKKFQFLESLIQYPKLKEQQQYIVDTLIPFINSKTSKEITKKFLTIFSKLTDDNQTKISHYLQNFQPEITFDIYSDGPGNAYKDKDLFITSTYWNEFLLKLNFGFKYTLHYNNVEEKLVKYLITSKTNPINGIVQLDLAEKLILNNINSDKDKILELLTPHLNNANLNSLIKESIVKIKTLYMKDKIYRNLSIKPIDKDNLKI